MDTSMGVERSSNISSTPSCWKGTRGTRTALKKGATEMGKEGHQARAESQRKASGEPEVGLAAMAAELTHGPAVIALITASLEPVGLGHGKIRQCSRARTEQEQEQGKSQPETEHGKMGKDQLKEGVDTKGEDPSKHQSTK